MTTTMEQKENGTMISTTYGVEGMTCGHCVSAVSAELAALDGVSDVSIVLNAGGVSSVTVTAVTAPLPEKVAAALDEAGDYHLASATQ
jgi:copper chaperone